jgi:hypothetical protein
MATIDARIRELLAAHAPSAAWRDRAAALGSTTTRRAVFQQHQLLRRLRDLDEGWLDKAGNQRVDDAFPGLRGVAIARTIQLELHDQEVLDESGPYSDFDPLNSVPFASIPFMDIWYSLVCLPGEPLARWPVVQCDPSAGDESVKTVAVGFEHFIHEWMCRDGPEFASPLAEQPDAIALEVIGVMHAVFRISVADARAALGLQRARMTDDAGIPVPRELGPYFPPERLRVLDRLAVLPPIERAE